MTATVESAFVLLDRASGPLRGIRRELRETRLEAERTARALDQVGGPRHARELDAQARAWRGLGGDVHGVGVELDWTAGRMDHVDRRTQVHVQSVRRARLEWSAFGDAMRPLRWPAVASGIGMVTQAAGGLAGGLVALTPQVLQASGTAAAAGPLFAGLAIDMGIVQLATHDLSEAYGGNERALRRLTPEGRAFLQVLRDFQPEIRRLRADAQQGLFPGLERALAEVQGGVPAAREVIRRSSRDLGTLAFTGAEHFTDPGRLRELVQVADTGSRAVGALGRSSMYLAGAMLHVSAAAGPMTDRLGTSIEGWARQLELEAQVAEETGRLDRFFVRSERSLAMLWDTGEHALGGLSGLLHAASGEGDSLWESINRGAERWDRWSNGFEGQLAMRRWFADTRPVLDETVGLVGDLGEVIGDLASSPGGARMLHELRQSLPDIGEGIGEITESFGPEAVHALDQGVGLLAELSEQTGPLTLLVRTLGNAAEATTALINALGPLGPAVVTTLGARSLLRRAGALGGGGAPGVSPLPAGGVPGMPMLPVPMVPLRGAGVGARVGAMTPGGVILPPGVRSVETAAAQRGGAGLIARARAAAGGLSTSGLGSLAASGGRFFGPAAAVMAVMGAAGADGSILNRLHSGLSQGTFGIVPGPLDRNEFVAAGQSDADQFAAVLRGGDPAAQRTDLARIDARIQALMLANERRVGGLRRFVAGGNNSFFGVGLGGDFTSDEEIRENRAEIHRLREHLRTRQDLLRDSVRAERQILDERSVRRGQGLLEDLGGAFDIRSDSRGPVAAMRETVDAALREQGRMRPAGARLVGEQMLAWAREQARHNPLLLAEVTRLEDGIKQSFSRQGRHVEIVNGQILTGSRAEWRGIRRAITTETEKARQEASADFTALQQQAVGSLVSMGFSRAEARQLVQGIEQGGATGKQAKGQIQLGPGVAGPADPSKVGRARGGRLPGHGLRDTVPMADGGWGAPGELVVNRHSERDADTLLSLFGTSLSRMVANETRPHGTPLVDRSAGPGPGGSHIFHARGGRLGQVPDAMGALPGLDVLAAILQQRFGLSVTSGLRPGAVTTTGNPSDHGWGGAIDVSNGVTTPQMDAAHAWLQAVMGPAIKQILYRTWLGGNHFNHIHVALTEAFARNPAAVLQLAGGDMSAAALAALAAGGLGGLGGMMQIPPLRPPRTRLRGVPGALRTAAGRAVAEGMTRQINAALAGGAGFGGFGGPGMPFAGGGKFIATAYGPPWGGIEGTGITSTGIDLPETANGQFIPIIAVDPSVIPYHSRVRVWPNPFGHRGYFRAEDTGGAIRGNRIDFLDMRGRQSQNAWGRREVTVSRSRGGRVGWAGWHADGVEMEVDRPTLFGAGENGTETVQVIPRGRARGDTRVEVNVQVNVTGAGRISPRQVRRIVEPMFEAFADELVEVLDGADADEAMG